MNKNLTLFGILIALLGVTYLFQEKKAEVNFEENLVKDKLYTGEIRKLKISGVEAERVDGRWKKGEDLLSHNIFKMIEDNIRQIKKLKDVTGESKDFFTTRTEFSVNGDEIILGDLSLDKQGFYLSQNGRIMLATLEGSSHELTSEADDIQATKLDGFRSLLSKLESELKEIQLFRYYPKLPLERVTIKIPGSLPFELDLKNNSTNPPPFPGIHVHDKLQLKFMSLLSQISLREEIPYEKFAEKLGEVTFIEDGKAVMWELYTRNNKSADAVVVDPVRRKAWLMIGGTLRMFFVQLQDYWDKKNIPPSHFKAFSREAMTFTEGNLRTIVTMINKEPLEFESTGFKVNKEKMLELVSYAMNLGPLDQANRVSLLSLSERKQILSEPHLQMEVFGQELLFWMKAEELIIVNLSQGYKCHYTGPFVPGGFRFKDVLE